MNKSQHKLAILYDIDRKSIYRIKKQYIDNNERITCED